MPLETFTVEMAKSDKADGLSSPETSQLMGYLAPALQLKGKVFSMSEIVKLELDLYNKIPKLQVKVKVAPTDYTIRNLVKDKELLKVFVRSSNDEVNHIRADFFIENFNKANRSSNEVHIIMEGELNIPKLYAHVNKAYRGTSAEVLQEVAHELNLGFATNTNSLDDSMVWIASNMTYLEFISYVASHAWADDYSFFDWYIDPYYNLIFYDANKALKYEEFEVKAYKKHIFTKEKTQNQSDEAKYISWTNALSDRTAIQSTDHGYSNLKIINNTKISKNGYVHNNILLDYNEQAIYNFKAEAISNTNEGMPLKSRLDDNSYKNEQRVHFLGIKNDNMFPNYLYAPIHNSINNLELKKINLEVDANALNLNYIVGDNIFLQVTSPAINNDNANDNFFEGNNANHIKSLTNSYMIKGIKHIYKNNEFTTRYLLTRREWPLDEDE